AVVGEFHWGRLRDALRGLDWLSDAVLVEARDRALAAAEAFLAFGLDLARQMDLPAATVLRNLAVLAPASALPMNRLAWRVAASVADAPAGCDFAGWLAFLDARARRHRVRFPLDRLVADPPRLSVGDVDLLLPEPGRTRFR